MSVIDAGRRFHERAIFLDECEIIREGEPQYVSGTGTYTIPETIIYSGVCHMAPFTGARTLDQEFGGEIVVTRNYQLKLPWDAPTILREDKVTMTVSNDPGMVGRVFRVDQVDGETHQMSRRVICEDITPKPVEES